MSIVSAAISMNIAPKNPIVIVISPPCLVSVNDIGDRHRYTIVNSAPISMISNSSMSYAYTFFRV